MAEKLDYFTAGQAAAITGVPYRTIDHWARTSLIVPSLAEAQGTGTERKYSFSDLVALRIARELRAASISINSLRKIVAFVRRKNNLQNPLSGARLVVVGSDVLIVNDCQELMSVLNRPGQGVFAFMVDLKRTVAEVREKVKELRAA